MRHIQVQILMIDRIQHDLHGRLQLRQIDDHPGHQINWPAASHVDGVIVAVEIRVVALAEDAQVLGGGQGFAGTGIMTF